MGRLARLLDDVLSRAHQLDDDEGEVRKAEGVRPAAADEKGLEGARVGLRRESVAGLGRDGHDLLPALGRTDDAAEGRDALARQKPRRRSVRRDHEVLDELSRPVLLLDREIDDGIVLEDRSRLDRLQIERAFLVPAGAQRLRRRVLGAQLLDDARDRLRLLGKGPSLETDGHGVVRELGVVAHRRAVELAAAELSVARHHHVGDDGEAVLAFVQRGPVRRELFREHREDLRRRVNARRVRARVDVDRRALLDDRIHVGDGDQDARSASGECLGDGELVEVFGVVVVDRDPEPLAQVPDPVARGPRRPTEGRKLREHVAREVRFEPLLDHRAAGDGLQVRAVMAGISSVACHARESMRRNGLRSQALVALSPGAYTGIAPAPGR